MADNNAFTVSPEALQQAVDWLLNHQSEIGGAAPWPAPFEVTGVWTDEGLGDTKAIEALARRFLPSAAPLNHPAYLAHMDPPTPAITWATSLWAAALNQNLLHPDTGQAARSLEDQVIQWLAPAFRMAGGHLVPGSTLANITGLWVARDLAGVDTVIASEMAHVSVRKAASLLGLTLQTVPADAAHRMQLDCIPAVDPARAAIVPTAGTTTAGAVDPLDALPGAAWRHVDAAWAGPLRLTSYADKLDGIQGADSVAVSAHKWLFQPKESAMVLFREPEAAHEAIAFGGSYLAAPNVGLMGSHGATALPLAATLLSWGRRGVAARIEACMAVADRLADRIAVEPALERFGPHETGIVLWRPRNHSVATVRDAADDAFVSLVEVNGEPWFRSVAANPLADPDRVVDGILDGMARV